jgi:uncharacterized protein (TIGR03435 family)
MLWRRAAVAIVLATVSLRAQAPQEPAFEVASVKRNTSSDSRTYFQVPPAGTVNITNANVRALVREAYEIDPSSELYLLVPPPGNPLLSSGKTIPDITGGPRFDVQARIPDDKSGQQRAMLRTLLAERFKLRVHREKRDLPVYALTVARSGQLGPGLRSSTVDCAVFFAERSKNPSLQPPPGTDGRPLCVSANDFSTPGSMGLRSAGEIKSLARMLQAFVDRPIQDEAGLKGSFEWKLTFGMTPNATDSGAPTIFTAVQEQLGLKLEARIAPFEVLVIDSVEMPSEN